MNAFALVYAIETIAVIDLDLSFDNPIVNKVVIINVMIVVI
jgi:hypothetical protein